MTGHDPQARLRAVVAERGDVVERIVETHLSMLAIAPDTVYKIKKPVGFAFCDLRTAAARVANAEHEVALNRRLAPAVYSDPILVRDDRGAVVDAVVVMQRLPDDRRLATIARDGGGTDCVVAVAQRLAAFHAAHPWPEAYDERAELMALWATGFEQWRPHRGPILAPDAVDEIESLAPRFLIGRAPLFVARAAAGRIVDGHGDLLADDIFCTGDAPAIIDCLEFDERLRIGDALLDLAFLAMDLDGHGRPDLATTLLATYAAAAGDRWPAAFEHHLVAYRAHVRAKVACLRADQGDAAAVVEARHRLAQCRDRLRRGRVRLVLVGGLPGTGKSTVAVGLADARDLVHLRSDVRRKERIGRASDDRLTAAPDAGEYAPTRRRAVYDDLLADAQQRLAAGESVVIDASWLDPERRAAARAAAERVEADLVAIECVAPDPLCRARIAARRASGGDASDATIAVFDALRDRRRPWPEADVIDTTRPVAESVAAAVMAFDR